MKKNRIRARAKKVNKITRNGLIEQNQVTKEKKYVSNCINDVSFKQIKNGNEKLMDDYKMERKHKHPRKRHSVSNKDLNEFQLNNINNNINYFNVNNEFLQQINENNLNRESLQDINIDDFKNYDDLQQQFQDIDTTQLEAEQLDRNMTKLKETQEEYEPTELDQYQSEHLQEFKFENNDDFGMSGDVNNIRFKLSNMSTNLLTEGRQHRFKNKVEEFNYQNNDISKDKGKLKFEDKELLKESEPTEGLRNIIQNKTKLYKTEQGVDRETSRNNLKDSDNSKLKFVHRVDADEKENKPTEGLKNNGQKQTTLYKTEQRIDEEVNRDKSKDSNNSKLKFAHRENEKEDKPTEGLKNNKQKQTRLYKTKQKIDEEANTGDLKDIDKGKLKFVHGVDADEKENKPTEGLKNNGQKQTTLYKTEQRIDKEVNRDKSKDSDNSKLKFVHRVDADEKENKPTEGLKNNGQKQTTLYKTEQRIDKEVNRDKSKDSNNSKLKFAHRENEEEDKPTEGLRNNKQKQTRLYKTEQKIDEEANTDDLKDIDKSKLKFVHRVDADEKENKPTEGLKDVKYKQNRLYKLKRKKNTRYKNDLRSDENEKLSFKKKEDIGENEPTEGLKDVKYKQNRLYKLKCKKDTRYKNASKSDENEKLSFKEKEDIRENEPTEGLKDVKYKQIKSSELEQKKVKKDTIDKKKLTGNGKLRFRKGENIEENEPTEGLKSVKHKNIIVSKPEQRKDIKNNIEKIELKNNEKGKLRFDNTENIKESEPTEGLKSFGQKRTKLIEQETNIQESKFANKYKKAEQKINKIDKKLKKAKSKLPKEYHVKLYKEYNNNSGKLKHRLHFESEIKQENENSPVLEYLVKQPIRVFQKSIVQQFHQKVSEVEDQNVAVKAAHNIETKAEGVLGKTLRWGYKYLKIRPYRTVRKIEKRALKANINLSYQKLLKENPELRKKIIRKWIQKKRIKKKYAKALKKSKVSHHVKQLMNATGQIIRAIAQLIYSNKTVLGFIAIFGFLFMMFLTSLSSCSVMVSSLQTSIIATCYVADEKHINDSQLYYAQLEADLQETINNIKSHYVGYDEYRFNIGEISHNPYELMAYLSTIFNDFTFDEVKQELDVLFSQQYNLEIKEIIERRTRINEYGEPEQYSWYVLQVTLISHSLTDIIEQRLQSGEQTGRYDVYMKDYGNRQAYSNPFDFDWLRYVSSSYGYRINPVTKQKELHKGIDIEVKEGTPIKAIQDGKIIFAGYKNDYGLCIIIENNAGYQSAYAHCSSILINLGQEVKRGDIIANVGSTGTTKDAHLHLEVIHNGEYLNPYYFVNNGSDGTNSIPGTSGGTPFPSNPSSQMPDGSFQAMIAEAEKYLGYPYVWGGSSPSTSFDCSGFVSWVINNSGVGNVGRKTAQGFYNICTPVSKEDARPGDLVFFTKTYSTPNPVSHIGIYVGENKMLHCGDPIGYANINSSYWSSHFYAFGRLN